MLDPDCIFCKIIRDEVPSSKVFEDERTLLVGPNLDAMVGELGAPGVRLGRDPDPRHPLARSASRPRWYPTR